MKSNIRNFSIISHIDHGKTTLTDRFLEITGTIPKRLMHARFLDSHPIEQERGVTIKLAPVRMTYVINHILRQAQAFGSEAQARRDPERGRGTSYILNLIDTPGHIDFSYEVSRSLAACEGAVLLVDATQGIQAQTLAHYHLAKKQGLVIIPVVNKIDLINARPQKVIEDMVASFGFSKEEIILVSAKTGHNVEQILKTIILKVPAPKGEEEKPLRALVFNSIYHPYKGVIAYVRIVDGSLDLSREKPELKFIGSQGRFVPLEIGYFAPKMTASDCLDNGKVGYIATGFKDVNMCQVGDTITEFKVPRPRFGLAEGGQSSKFKVRQLPGYREPKPMVFFDFYPVENKDFSLLEEALEQLKLNDFSLQFTAIGSPALGKGFRVGFLGVFHAVITQERLEKDANLDIVITSPSVEYQLVTQNGDIKTIQNASEIENLNNYKEVKEPWVKMFIFTPLNALGSIFKLCQENRGKFINQQYFGNYANLEYEMPLIELISGFYDKLKSVSSGFASLDYQFLGFQSFEAVKLDVFIHKQKVDALSMIVPQEKGEYLARSIAKKLKEAIPRQMFETAIQVTLNNKIMARETLRAFSKDVTAKLYGGDQTRKDKLIEKQRKGKKRMKMVGRVNIPQEAFMSVLRVK